MIEKIELYDILFQHVSWFDIPCYKIASSNQYQWNTNDNE